MKQTTYEQAAKKYYELDDQYRDVLRKCVVGQPAFKYNVRRMRAIRSQLREQEAFLVSKGWVV